MKLTKSQLRQIIREEATRLREGPTDLDLGDTVDTLNDAIEMLSSIQIQFSGLGELKGAAVVRNHIAGLKELYGDLQAAFDPDEDDDNDISYHEAMAAVQDWLANLGMDPDEVADVDDIVQSAIDDGIIPHGENAWHGAEAAVEEWMQGYS